MSRANLLWLAGGAALASAATIGAQALKKERTSQTAFLILEEPLSDEGDEVSDDEMIANQTGRLMRECGARSFETTFLYDDHSPTADLPLIAANDPAFSCVLKTAAARGISMNIEIRTVRNAQTH